jgi:hypothetical protein
VTGATGSWPVPLPDQNQLLLSEPWQVQAINATPSGVQWSWRVIVMAHIGRGLLR